MARTGKQRLAAVVFCQFFAADPLLAALRFAGQYQGPAVLAPASKHRAAMALEQQQDRQVQAVDGVQFTAQQTSLQTCAGCGAWQQVDAQPLLGQGQARAQTGAAGAAIMQFAEDEQAIQ